MAQFTSDFTLTPEKTKELVVQTLDADKAEDIEVINLAAQTSIADYMIVASGSSTRQVVALAEKLKVRLGLEGIKEIRLDGTSQGDWVVLDAGDIIVHIFRPEVREYYGIEKMWRMSQPLQTQDSLTH